MSVVPRSKLNKFGGVYTSEIPTESRKQIKKSISKQPKCTNKKKIFVKNPNKSNKNLQKLIYRRWFSNYQPKNVRMMKKLKIFKNHHTE